MSASKYFTIHNKDFFITYTANSGASFYDTISNYRFMSFICCVMVNRKPIQCTAMHNGLLI